MAFSNLQKFILKKIWESRKVKVSRDIFNKYYQQVKKAPKKELRTKIITQSIERLIDRGLLIGFGERTRFKWFIKEVRLTSKGKKQAKKLQGEQVPLPFRKKK